MDGIVFLSLGNRIFLNDVSVYQNLHLVNLQEGLCESQLLHAVMSCPLSGSLLACELT